MERSPIDKLTAWFDDHDDGKFAHPARTHPFRVIGPTPSASTVLYTTKPECVLALAGCETDLAIGLIGRCGLPNEDDVAWLRMLVRDRVVCFLGDADPVDLLVFAWLRSRIDVKYAGVSDFFLSNIGISWNDRVTIPLSDSESGALALLADLCPDFQILLGSQCPALLDRGRKLEIEAATIHPENRCTDADECNHKDAMTNLGTVLPVKPFSHALNALEKGLEKWFQENE